MAKNIADIRSSGRGDPQNKAQNNFTLPTYITAGYSTTVDLPSGLGNQWLLSIDNEIIYGRYGSSAGNQARFWLLRGGIEKYIHPSVCLRGGVIIPIIAETDSLGSIRDDLPGLKIGGALGIGVTVGNMIFDAAVYGDPARGYIEQSVRIKGVASLSLRF
jgi:hypothetical protein